MKASGCWEGCEEQDDDEDDADGPEHKDCDGGADDDDEEDDHLGVNGHTEIPDKSSGSTSRSAPWRCQVQRTLMMILILTISMLIMMIMAMMMMMITKKGSLELLSARHPDDY